MPQQQILISLDKLASGSFMWNLAEGEQAVDWGLSGCFDVALSQAVVAAKKLRKEQEGREDR